MSPLDTELRHTLAERAADVDGGTDLWVRVEQRARVLHRRRVAAGGAAGAVVVAAVVVVGVGVAGGNQADRVVPSHPGPLPSTTTAQTPTAGRDSVAAWPAVGADPTWVKWDAVVQSMPAQMPSGFAPLGTPHVIGSGDADGGPVAVFVIPVGDHLVAGAVLRSAPDVAVAVHDIPTDGDVPYVGVVVHVQASGGQVDDGVVVGAPTTGQIEFRLPGESAFHPVEGGADPRWAAVTLGHVTPGEPVAQVRVLDGDGNMDRGSNTGPIQVGLTFPDV